MNPDLVVVGFCPNDPQPRGQDWSVERQQLEDSYAGRFFDTITRIMRLVLLSTTAKRMQQGALTLAEWFNVIPPWTVGFGRTYDARSLEWRSFEAALKEIKELSDTRSLPPPSFAVLNRALKTGVAGDYQRYDDHLYLHWYLQAKDAALANGFVAIDFESELRQQDPSMNLIINQLDAHPSKELNALYAAKLTRSIAPTVAQRLEGHRPGSRAQTRVDVQSQPPAAP